MAQTVYFAHTGPELAKLSALVEQQAQQMGMDTSRLELKPDMAAASILDEARQRIAQADLLIAMLGYLRGAGVEGPSLAPLVEVELDFALEADIPAAIFLPRPGSEIEMYLRRYAFGQPEAQREAQEAFLARIQQQQSVFHYSDEADLSKQITLVLAHRQMQTAPDRKSMLRGLVSKYADALTGHAKAVPPPPAPPAPAPAPAPADKESPGRAREQAEPAPEPPTAAPLPFDIDALAEAIAARTAASLRALQLEDQEAAARRAVEYAEALRMHPGDLIFGRPNTASQFKSDAFMIMPFNPAFDGVYRSVAQPLFAEMGLTIKRGDEFTSARGSIISEVWAALNACRFVIADITGGNDNVFYELGIAHTLNKPTLLITQADTPEQVPFDLRHLRYIAYRNTLAGADQLRADLKHAVEWLLNELRETWET